MHQTIMAHRKRSSSSSLAVIIAENDDLLLEILLRSPAKSLIRFQAVSKHWRSLISDPSFSRNHTINLRNRRHHDTKPHNSFILLLTTNKSYMFICNPTVKRLVPLFNCLTDDIYYIMRSHIKQSCNGLLFLEWENRRTGDINYYVYNPTTRLCRHLSITEPFSGLYLAFDPRKSPDYRVVCFTENGSSTRIVVFDSSTLKWNEWKEVDNTSSSDDFSNGIYANDRIYFIRSSFYFSLVDGNIYSIANPPNFEYYYAVESNGHLIFIGKSDRNRLYVYEFKRDWYSVGFWLAKYRVDYSPVLATFATDYGFKVQFLGIIRGEREEDSVLLLHGPGKIIIYRFVEEVFEVLVDFRGKHYWKYGQFQFKFNHVHQFVESLAPV